MSAQSTKKKRFGSRRWVADQKADELHVTDSTSVVQHSTPGENTESLNMLANPDYSKSETQNPPSPELSKHRKKMGSSRRNKGGQRGKDSATESYNKPREEVEEKTRSNETPQKKQTSLTIQPQQQEELSQRTEHDTSARHDSSLHSDITSDYFSEVQYSTGSNNPETDQESLISKSPNLQANQDEHDADYKVVSDSCTLLETKSDTFQKEEPTEIAHLVGISEVTSLNLPSGPTVDQQLIDQSSSTEIAGDERYNVNSATEKESKERHVGTYLLGQDGNLQGNNLENDSHVKSVVTEFSTIPEITNDQSSPRTNTELECSVEQAIFSSPNEHLNLHQVNSAQHSQDATNKECEQEFKPTEMYEINHSSSVTHVTEDAGVISGNVLDQAEIGDTCLSELIVKSTDDSATGQLDSNPDDKHDVHPTNNFDTSKQTHEDDLYDTETPQINLMSESHLRSDDIELSTETEITTDDSRTREHTEPECSIQQAMLSSPKDGLPKNEVEGVHHLEDTVNKVHEQEVKPTQKHEMDHYSDHDENDKRETDFKVEVSDKSVGAPLEEMDKSDTLQSESSLQTPQSGTDASLDSQPEQNDTDFNSIGNRRKLGSTRRNKGRHRVKESVAESYLRPTEEVVESVSDNEALETTQMLIVIEKTNQEELSQESEHDVVVSTTDENSLYSAIMSDYSSEVQSSNTTNYPETDMESLIPKSENLQGDHDDEVKTTHELDHSSESMTQVATEDAEIISGNLTDQAEISDTHQFEFIVKDTDDSSIKQEDLNPVDTQDVHPTKENSIEALEQTNEDEDTEKLQIIDTERVDSALGHEYEGEGKVVEDDIKPSVEQTVHQEKEGILSGEEESESSLQTQQSETNAPLDSQPQQNDTDFNSIGNRRKLGSTRRNKGRHRVKESVAESYLRPTEEVVESVSDNEALETTQMLIAIEKTNQEESSPESCDVVVPATDDNSLYSAIMSYYSSEVQSSNTTNYPETDMESLIPKSENLQEDHDERESDFKVEVSDKSVEATLEEMDRCDTLQSQEDRGTYHSEDNVDKVHEQEANPTHEPDHSSESVTQVATEDAEIISGNLIDPAEISDTYQSEMIVKSTDDFAAKQEDSNTDDKQDAHPTKENSTEVFEQTNEDEDTEKLQISDTERVDSALGHVYEGEASVVEDDIKPSVEQTVNQEKEELISEVEESESSLQTQQSETNAHLDSQPQQSDTDSNSIGNRRKLGSTRRTKGRQPVKESVAESYLRPTEEVVESVSDNEALETTQMLMAMEKTNQEESSPESCDVVLPSTDENSLYSAIMSDYSSEVQSSNTTNYPETDMESLIPKSENLQGDHDEEVKTTHELDHSSESVTQVATEDAEIISGNLTDQAEISDTYKFEFIVKGTDDSSIKQEDLNPVDTQDVHPTKENSIEALEQTNEDEDTEKLQIIDTERVDSALGHEYEGEGKVVEDDIKPSVEQTVHQEKEGILSGEEESESSLQTQQSETNAPLDSQPQQNDTDFNSIGNRRKLGSTRRNKGRHQVKESVAESYLRPTEVVESVSDNEALETTQILIAIEKTNQEESSPESCDVVVPATDDNSLYSAIMSDYSSEVQSSNTTNYPETDMESLIPKSENLQEDHDERESDFKVEVSDKSVEATLEEMDQSDNLQSQEDRGTYHSEDSVDKVHEQEANPTHELDHSSESVTQVATEDAEIISGNLIDQAEISDTYQSEMIVKSTDDFAAKQEDSNTDDKQDAHPTKENSTEALEQTNEDEDTEKLQISDTERVDSALGHEYEGESKVVEDDIKPSVEQTVHQEKEGILSGEEESESSLQTQQSETNAPLDSQPQQNDTDFNSIGNRRKLGSTRRHKGRHQVKESVAESYLRPTEEVVESVSDNEALETTQMLVAMEKTNQEESSPESCDVVLPSTDENSLYSAIMSDYSSEVQSSNTTNYPETDMESLIPKSENLQGDHDDEVKTTHELDHSSESMTQVATEDAEIISGNLTDQAEISDTHQFEFIVKGTDDSSIKQEDLNPVDTQDVHPTKENSIEALEQTNEDEDTEKLQIMDTERVDSALGHKYEGESKVVEDDIKPSVEQTVHQEKEGLNSEVEESNSSLQTLQTGTNAYLDSQPEQNNTDFNLIGSRRKMGSSRRNRGRRHAKDPVAESNDSPAEEIVGNTRDNAQTEGIGDQVKENEHVGALVGISEFMSSTLHISTEKRSTGKHGDIEFVKQAAFSSPKEELSTNEEQEHVNFSQVRGSLHSENILNEVHEEVVKSTQMQEMDQIDFSSVNESLQSETNALLNSQDNSQDNSVRMEEETDFNPTGNRRKLGSSRRNKGQQQVKVSVAKTYHEPKDEFVENARGDEALETTKMLLAADTTGQEEFKQQTNLDLKPVNNEENTEKILQGTLLSQNVMNNSASGTTDITSSSGKDDSVESNEDVKEHENFSQFTGNDTVVDTEVGEHFEDPTKKDREAQEMNISRRITHAELFSAPQNNIGTLATFDIGLKENRAETVMDMPEEGGISCNQQQGIQEKTDLDNSENLQGKFKQKRKMGSTRRTQLNRKPEEGMDKMEVVELPVIVTADVHQNENAKPSFSPVDTEQQGISVISTVQDLALTVLPPVDPTKENNFEALEQKNEEQQISGIERVDTALGQVYVIEEEDDIKPSAEQTVHQKKEGLFSEVEESDSSLQTLQSGTNVTLDSQPEQNDTNLNPIGSRRKLGSSRRNKGRQHAKDSEQQGTNEISTVQDLALTPLPPEQSTVDVEPQLDDFTSTEMHVPSVLAKTNTTNIGITGGSFVSSYKATQSIQNDEERPESVNLIQNQALKPAEAPVVADLEMMKSTVRGGADDEHKDNQANIQELNDVNEGAHDTNLEMKDSSPNLDSPSRRRKLGSSRRKMVSRTKREDIHQQQEVENEATETNVGDVKSASFQSIEEKEELQPLTENKEIDSEQRKEKVFETVEDSHAFESHVKPPPQQEIEENPAPHVQPVETDHQLTPSDLPAILPTSPAAGEARRKLGSSRKSRGHQTEKGERTTETQKRSDVRSITEESDTETTEEGSLGLDKISEVDESDKKPPSNISTSKAEEHSRPVSENTPQQVTPVHSTHAEIRLSQESQKTLSLAGSPEGAAQSNSYNVIMVGDSCVGKSSFMKRAQSGKFSLDLPASVGLDSCIWTVVVDGKPVVLHLWDTAGQERFHSITRQIFHKAQAFLLMYDITSTQSFSAVSYWANCIQEGAAENVTILLLGNKTDKAERKVETQEGAYLALEYNFEFMECSAATGENVIHSLETVARMLSQKVDTREETMVLHKEPQKKKSGCC